MDSATTCMICLSDRIRIPCFYKEACFRCRKEPGKPGCHSIQRYCLVCIRNHLQLNLPRAQRSTSVKCPLCPAVANPRLLNQQTSYEPDYRMMMSDPATDYPCFHSDKGCDFTGSQTDLHKHMKNCGFSITSCQHCGQYFEHRLRAEHTAICPSMSNCPLCASRIVTADLHKHCFTEHQQRSCQHCKEWVDALQLDTHILTTCPQRIIRCTHCSNGYRPTNKSVHLMKHLHEIEISMGYLADEMHSLRQRMSRLLREINE